MDKDIFMQKGKWRTEGYLSISLRNFGLGFFLYAWRPKTEISLGGGFSINLHLLFLDFHLETWKRP